MPADSNCATGFQLFSLQYTECVRIARRLIAETDVACCLQNKEGKHTNSAALMCLVAQGGGFARIDVSAGQGTRSLGKLIAGDGTSSSGECHCPTGRLAAVMGTGIIVGNTS